jgi:hypothetical protein
LADFYPFDKLGLFFALIKRIGGAVERHLSPD